MVRWEEKKGISKPPVAEELLLNSKIYHGEV